AEFMAALLSTVMGRQNKVGQYIRECQEMGIEVLPPDINRSGYEFKTYQDNKIFFGLKAIKNVGRSAIVSIINARKDGPFLSMDDFLQRVNLSKVNVQVTESLIKAGAFSSFNQNRAQLLIKFEEIYEKAYASRQHRVAGQTSFFDIVEDQDSFFQNTIKYPDIGELAMDDILAQEKEYLGIYLSAHPLDISRDKINLFSSCDSIRLEEDDLEGEEVIFSGMVIDKKNHVTKRNSMMALLTVEDWSGKIDVVVFPDTYSEYEDNLSVGSKVIIQARIDDGSIIARSVISLSTPFLLIEISDKLHDLDRIRKLLRENHGKSPVFINVSDNLSKHLLMTDSIFWVDINNNFKKDLSKLIGKDNFEIY
ncbi:MAG: OB-fold nucleic acid binding domain-containing protein, partial [Halanaerobiales bacterium]